MAVDLVRAVGQPRPRQLNVRFLEQPDGTYAEVVYAVRKTSGGNDLVQADGDKEKRPLNIKYKDMGDGTHARIIFIP